MTTIIIGIFLTICIILFMCYKNNELTQQIIDSNDENRIINGDINNNLESKTINHFGPQLLPVLEHGFHDNFANNNKLLGWRHWYLKNKSNYQVESTGNFEDIPTKHYLKNMGSLDSWFEKLYTLDINDQIIE